MHLPRASLNSRQWSANKPVKWCVAVQVAASTLELDAATVELEGLRRQAAAEAGRVAAQKEEQRQLQQQIDARRQQLQELEKQPTVRWLLGLAALLSLGCAKQPCSGCGLRCIRCGASCSSRAHA
jgi:hypothetical protein